MTKQEIENRITLYGLISRLMITEVDLPLLKTLHENKALLSLFPRYATQHLLECAAINKQIEQELHPDYAHLFLMHLVPYESFYRRDDQMIESGGENPVMGLYNSFDFRVNLQKARIVSSDHIGVEFEFMMVLAKALLEAFEANDTDAVVLLLENQKDFLTKHLLEWAPMFLIALAKEAQSSLYKDVADLALEFMLSDYEWISSQLKEVE